MEMEHCQTPPLTLAPEESPDEATIRAVESGLNAHSAGLGLRTDLVAALDSRSRRRRRGSGWDSVRARV